MFLFVQAASALMLDTEEGKRKKQDRRKYKQTRRLARVTDKNKEGNKNSGRVRKQRHRQTYKRTTDRPNKQK